MNSKNFGAAYLRSFDLLLRPCPAITWRRRISIFYAVAPFIGVGLSFLIFQTSLFVSFTVATVIMISVAYFAATGIFTHR